MDQKNAAFIGQNITRNQIRDAGIVLQCCVDRKSTNGLNKKGDANLTSELRATEIQVRSGVGGGGEGRGGMRSIIIQYSSRELSGGW